MKRVWRYEITVQYRRAWHATVGYGTHFPQARDEEPRNLQQFESSVSGGTRILQ